MSRSEIPQNSDVALRVFQEQLIRLQLPAHLIPILLMIAMYVLVGCGNDQPTGQENLTRVMAATTAEHMGTNNDEATAESEVRLTDTFEWVDSGVRVTIVSTGQTLPLRIQIDDTTSLDESSSSQTHLVDAKQVVLTPTAAPEHFISSASMGFFENLPSSEDTSNPVAPRIYFEVKDLNPTGPERKITVRISTTTSEPIAVYTGEEKDPEQAKAIQNAFNAEYGIATDTITNALTVTVGGQSAQP